jgi:hypothetical protein
MLNIERRIGTRKLIAGNGKTLNAKHSMAEKARILVLVIDRRRVEMKKETQMLNVQLRNVSRGEGRLG